MGTRSPQARPLAPFPHLVVFAVTANGSNEGTAAKRSLVITVAGAGDSWESDVEVNGRNVGGGTGPSASSALDVAMNVLYGDTNDWLNGDEGAIRDLEEMDRRVAA